MSLYLGVSIGWRGLGKHHLLRPEKLSELDLERLV